MKLSRQLLWCLMLVTLNNLLGLAVTLWNVHNLAQARKLAETLQQSAHVVAVQTPPPGAWALPGNNGRGLIPAEGGGAFAASAETAKRPAGR